MSNELMLALWTALGLAWWLVSWWLAEEVREPGAPLATSGAGTTAKLSIFKPLPPRAGRPLTSREMSALESFIAQVDGTNELLLGIHQADRAALAPFLERLAQEYPGATVRPVYRTEPDAVANPKIAWLQLLAAHAKGELWLWSDEDIIAPAGFLRDARAEYAQGGAGLLTFPYVIRETLRQRAALDALFVNVEFVPGVLLLRRLGPVDFAFGAGCLFSRRDFFEKAGWDDIGSWLADDFALGQRLQPVRIGRAVLETTADETTWRGALLHYLRWSKTVCWSRMAGVAAKLFILPGVGWAAALSRHPHESILWGGLFFTLQMDTVFAFLISRRAGCRCPLAWLPVVEFWSVWRLLVWAGCWLPWPVVWRGQTWWRARKSGHGRFTFSG